MELKMKGKVYIRQITADVFEIDIPDSVPEGERKQFAINKAKEQWRSVYYPEVQEVTIDER